MGIQNKKHFLPCILIFFCLNAFNLHAMFSFMQQKMKNMIKEAISEERIARNTVSQTFSTEELKATLLAMGRDMIIMYGFTGLSMIVTKLIFTQIILYTIVQKTKNDFKTVILTNKSYNKSLSKQQKNIAEKSKNISTLFMGKEGSGKTFIMANVGRTALKEGAQVYWLNPFIFLPTETTKLFGITQKDIFNKIVNDAKKEAVKRKKPSYILIDELHRSPLYTDSMLHAIFLEYLNNEDNREIIKTFATTNDTKIHSEVYRAGRFELQVILTGDEDFDEPYKKVQKLYQKMRQYSPTVQQKRMGE